jgi:hypothetical protein
VFGYKAPVEYDFVIVSSPNYWRSIVGHFAADKVLIHQTESDTFLPLDEYMLRISEKSDFDVLLLPFNKSNVTDLAMIARELSDLGLSSALIDIGADMDSNLAQGLRDNEDVKQVSRANLDAISKRAIVTSTDWEKTFTRPFLQQQRAREIITIGVVDGIEDFEDADYGYQRDAYRTVEYVFTMGSDDQHFLQDKIEKTTVVGLPKLFPLYREPVLFPENDLVVINVNFTYGSHEDARDNWLEAVIAVCKSLKLDYIISQHHADNGDLETEHISQYSAYDTIRRGSILVSRFSTLILESLVLGKPVVYFNPHNEKVKLYKEPLGAFSLAYSQAELASLVSFELSRKISTRIRAKQFLDNKCNISCETPPAKLIAHKIKDLIADSIA